MKYSLLGACAIACCCATSVFAQGLTRVEALALQQQLRDDGCGTSHITGHVDATTRADVKKCETKYSGATDPASMLAAMKIGFGNGIPDPTLSMARSGEGGSMSAGGVSGSSMNQGSTNGSGTMTDTTAHHARRRMMRDSTRMMRDSTIRHDTAGTKGSGGAVDMNKPTPMTPPTSTTNPATNPNPTMPPSPATPTNPTPTNPTPNPTTNPATSPNPMPPANPKDTSTTPRDTSSIHNGTKP